MAESGGESASFGAEDETVSGTTRLETPLDPTAAALAAQASHSSPQLAQQAAAYFRKQSQLVWGEALLRTGDYSSAIAKFKQAAQFAPRWGHLYLTWGQALDRAGKHAAALAQYHAAAGMDLSAADRAALAEQVHT